MIFYLAEGREVICYRNYATVSWQYRRMTYSVGIANLFPKLNGSTLASYYYFFMLSALSFCCTSRLDELRLALDRRRP